MGKPRIIAETGAGQHGVATATVASSTRKRLTIDQRIRRAIIAALRRRWPRRDRLLRPIDGEIHWSSGAVLSRRLSEILDALDGTPDDTDTADYLRRVAEALHLPNAVVDRAGMQPALAEIAARQQRLAFLDDLDRAGADDPEAEYRCRLPWVPWQILRLT